MTDMIDRQAAVDAVIKHLQLDREYARGVREAINALPSAQPKRNKGKWIQYDNGNYYCSLCHSWIPEEQYHYARFCLYCGAEMEQKDG